MPGAATGSGCAWQYVLACRRKWRGGREETRERATVLLVAGFWHGNCWTRHPGRLRQQQRPRQQQLQTARPSHMLIPSTQTLHRLPASPVAVLAFPMSLPPRPCRGRRDGALFKGLFWSSSPSLAPCAPAPHAHKRRHLQVILSCVAAFVNFLFSFLLRRILFLL